ncbi:transmembrane protease serine 2-like [Xyrauchen texanus]|uniref:transmembrane protease serine 2-like n=1 Tax=Xyrauchen texanus TaxID=154827 RepID=UPI002242746B|nr:transmembrane protease serine 2-like [Xyrauchen texanus]
MNSNAIYDNVAHVNYGFQHEEQRPPQYAPSSDLPPQYQNTSPSNPSDRYSPAQSLNQYIPQKGPVKTHSTTTPGFHHVVNKVPRKRIWPYVVGTVITLLVIAVVVIAALLWYFGMFNCQERRCTADQQCISHSQWCNGVPDCPSGEDEAHCFRLYGSDFILQMYSYESRKWENVCSSGWNKNLGRQACEEIGYSSDTYVGYNSMSSRALLDNTMVKTDFLSSSNLNMSTRSFLIKSSDCPSNSVVALKCTGKRISFSISSTREVFFT